MDSTNNHSNRHIRFDLSKNQTYFIENETHNTDNTVYISTITVLTSFLFITNTTLACIKKKYIYAALFACLFFTSIAYRYMENIYPLNKYALIVDKTVIFFIFVYGTYVLYTGINSISKIYIGCVISTFIAIIIMYYYGCKYNCFCFDKDNYISENYMALVHIIGSIGHNLLILL
jgi:hypothetical protein